MDQSFEEFIKSVKKVNGNRPHKIKHSITRRNSYLYYRKVRPKESEYVLSETKYASIINEMNRLWVDKLLEKKSLLLPEGLGRVNIKKRESITKIDSNGNLVTNRPIDLDKTLRLWYNDKEAFDNKTKVRYESDYTYKITHSRSGANCKNLSYFRIQFNRGLKQKLKNLINEGNFDTFKIHYE